MKNYLFVLSIFFASGLFAQSDVAKNQEKTKIRIDIISDVVCPWCYIGYHRLQKSLNLTNNKINADIHFHPFILNGHYPEGGVNYKQHLIKKYHRTAEQVDAVRQRHITIGNELGIKFTYSEDMKTYNSIKAHQLVRLAREYGKETEMKTRLMTAFFAEQKNISDIPTLLKEAKDVGLDLKKCKDILENDKYVKEVLNEINEWKSRGVSSVPSYIINNEYIISGAQDAEYLAKVLLKLAKEKKN